MACFGGGGWGRSGAAPPQIRMDMAVERAVTVLMAGAEWGEDGSRALPDRAQSRQELGHRGIVGHEKIVARDGEREMPVADVEGDADGLVPIPWRHGEHGLGFALDLEIPVRLDGHDVPRMEQAPRGQRESDLSAARGGHALARPAPLLPGQAERVALLPRQGRPIHVQDRKSTRLNSSHVEISYAVFCLKK